MIESLAHPRLSRRVFTARPPRRVVAGSLPAIVCIALLAGCNARRATRPAEEARTEDSVLALKSYDVPADQADQIRAALVGMFQYLEKPAVARAELSPDGQLLVLATGGIQEGVDDLLARMASRKPPPQPGTIEMEYWFVLGQKSKENAIDPALQEITPTLEAVTAAQGPMRFAQLESTRLLALSGERGESQGRHASVQHRASVNAGKILSDVEITIGGAVVKTRLSMAPGTFVVLGQSGVRMDPFRGTVPFLENTPGEGPTVLFYVVRATVRDAS